MPLAPPFLPRLRTPTKFQAVRLACRVMISALYKSNNKLEKPSLVNYSIALKRSKSQMGKAEATERFLVSDYCEPEFEYLHEG